MKAIVIYCAEGKRLSALADKIAKEFNCEALTISPKEAYGKGFQMHKRILTEIKNHTLADYEASLPDLSQVDTVFIGYPIWYAHVPAYAAKFVSELDLNGKKLIPFTTSLIMGTGVTLRQLENATKASMGKSYSLSRLAPDDFDAWVSEIKNV